MCGQTALVLIFMIVVFQVECKGDMFWVIILTILQGLCGMCFGELNLIVFAIVPPGKSKSVSWSFFFFFFLNNSGFVISAICELERNAIQLALGSFYPTLLLSGNYLIFLLSHCWRPCMVVCHHIVLNIEKIKILFRCYLACGGNASCSTLHFLGLTFNNGHNITPKHAYSGMADLWTWRLQWLHCNNHLDCIIPHHQFGGFEGEEGLEIHHYEDWQDLSYVCKCLKTIMAWYNASCHPLPCEVQCHLAVALV